MTMAAVVVSALLLWQGAHDEKVGDLIRDLGAEEHSVRERAEGELRMLGDSAIPALREALEDKDPERAIRARRVLEDLEKKGRRSDQEQRSGSRAWMAYRDFGRGITFETHPDGKVELTVREPGGDSGKRDTRTYRADSLEDFKKKYPALAAKYDVDNLVPRERWSFFGDSKDSWDAWKKRFDKDWFWDKDAMGKFLVPWFPFGPDALDTWVLDQKKRFEEFRKIEPPARGDAPKEMPGKPQLGITVERVASALADQLGLGVDQGLLIAEVKPSSPAERAGLRKHDILLKVNGRSLTGPDELRRDVEAGLKTGMELEVLRRGKSATLKVEPVASSSK
ncbi:MAG: PDZ domain-containing protein [Planctomycetota bacterium]|nr:MAG: PDZ domain-containing protein [Planctomycetota bacterium]